MKDDFIWNCFQSWWNVSDILVTCYGHMCSSSSINDIINQQPSYMKAHGHSITQISVKLNKILHTDYIDFIFMKLSKSQNEIIIRIYSYISIVQNI